MRSRLRGLRDRFLRTALCGLPLLLHADAARSSLEASALLYQHGNYVEALQRLETLPPGSSELDAAQAELLKGLIYLKLGRPGEAIPWFKRATERPEAGPDAWVDLGLAYQGSARWSEAEAAYQRAQKAWPKRPEAWLGSASLAFGRGDWEPAEAAYRTALGLDPGDAAAWAALANVLLARGQLKQAIDARERSLSLKPDDALQFKQAVAWYSLGDLERAAAALDKAQAGDKPEAYLLRGNLANRRGDLDKAARLYQAALDLRPGYAEARLNLGITYYGLKDYEKALAAFKQVSRRDAVWELAQDYARQAEDAEIDAELSQGADAVMASDFPGAVAHWERAKAMSRDPAPVQRMIDSLRRQQGPRAEVLASQGEQAMASGDLAAALQAWDDALRIDPQNKRAAAGRRAAGKDVKALVQAYEEAGQRRLDLGDFDGARSWVEGLDKVSPQAGQALRQAVELSLRKSVQELEASAQSAEAAGRPEDSLGFYGQALALDPGNSRLQTRERAARAALQRKVSALLADAVALEHDGKVQAAYDSVQKARSLAPDSLEAKADSERLAKRLDLKLLSPQAVDDLYYRGVYLYGNGDTSGALKLWRQGLEANPQHRPLRQAVRSAEAKLKALAHLERR